MVRKQSMKTAQDAGAQAGGLLDRISDKLKGLSLDKVPEGARNAAIGSALGALIMGANRATSKDEDDDSTVGGEALRGAIGGGIAGYAIPEGLSQFGKFLNDGAGEGRKGFNWLTATLGGGATAVATGTVGAGAHVLRALRRHIADPRRPLDWTSIRDSIRNDAGIRPSRLPNDSGITARFFNALWNHVNGSKWGNTSRGPRSGRPTIPNTNGRRILRGGAGLGVSLLAAVLSGIHGNKAVDGAKSAARDAYDAVKGD